MYLKILKYFFYIVICHLSIFDSFGQDTSKNIQPLLKNKSLCIGILIAPGYWGGYEQTSVKNLSKVPYLYSIGSLLAEYTFKNHFSIITGFTYGYNYFRDTINEGSISGIIELRYCLPITSKKRIIQHKRTLFYIHFGLGYTKGYYFNTPNLKNINKRIECLVINPGFGYFPSKLFRKPNNHLFIEYSVARPIIYINNKKGQFFGGLGIKYKF